MGNIDRYDTGQQVNRGKQATVLLVLICLVAYPLGIKNEGLLAYSYNNLFGRHEWWTLITALVVHGSLGHLLGNMLFLFLFGSALEQKIGPGRLLLVFFTGGIISLLASYLFYDHNIPVVGASGSICAILGLLMIYSPWKISFLLNFFPMPMGVAALSYMAMNFFMALRNNGYGNTAHTAYELHITGFIVGILFGVLWHKDWKLNLFISVVSFIAFYVLLAIIFFHYRFRIFY